MPIANQEMIRDNNRRLVLEYIVNNPPVSRADLSKHLKLTKATISAIVQDLLLQNLILEAPRPLWGGSLSFWSLTSSMGMPWL